MEALTAFASDLPRLAVGFALLFARVGAMLMLLPGFSDDAVPGRIRLLIALGTAAGMRGLLDPQLAEAAGSALAQDIMLARLVLTEMLVGVMLGAVIRLLFMGIALAGAIVSTNIGLSSALVHDPAAGGQVPVLARLMAVAALLVCLAAQVHHLWIGALVGSYDTFPVGALPPAGDFARLALRAATAATGMGLSLAAPVVIYSIVFNCALGLAARLAPQLQVFFIAQPLNLLLGLAVTAAALGAGILGFADAMGVWARGLAP